MGERIVFSWSGGKDSAMALAEVRAAGDYEVAALLTTITDDDDRVSSHGVRRTLLAAQAEALGLPLHEVRLPKATPNEVYVAALGEALAGFGAREGIDTVAFADLHLADIRAWREQTLAGLGARCLFPVWQRDTVRFAREMIDAGLRAVVVCLDPGRLDRGFAGRAYDASFLADLPDGVDPCGENGEFHTYVHDGPGFGAPIPVGTGEVVERDGLVYCDLLPG